MTDYCYLLQEKRLYRLAEARSAEFREAVPFPHVVIDDFLPQEHAEFLLQHFPPPDHRIWKEKTHASQYRKLSSGGARPFSRLEPAFALAMQEFNTWKLLTFLEALTGIAKLLPDPYFLGGGIHQILKGGMLDIHTDFNDHQKIDLYRCLNVLIYLNPGWEPSWGGCLELWDGGAQGGKCVKAIPPIFNRAVVFQTDKRSFHGHPKEWNAPEPITRKSIALYYYTARQLEGQEYTAATDFQGIFTKHVE